MSMEKIQKLTEAYAAACDEVYTLTADLNAAVEILVANKRGAIKAATSRLASTEQRLRDELKDNKPLFERPRTQVFSGFKVGFQKQPGSLDWEDDKQLVKLIHKHFPNEAERLIKTEEKPIAATLKSLEAADLRKLGISQSATGDAVVIIPVDGIVDKLSEAMLKSARARLAATEEA
jgi:hypothetical protein